MTPSTFFLKNKNGKILVTILVTIILYSLLISNLSTVKAVDKSSIIQQLGVDYSEVIKNINMTRIAEHIKFFSSLGTRATGYLGNRLAAKYIYDQFNSYGLSNLTLHEFEVVDCIDHGTNITFLSTGETFDLYSVRPNFIVPSTTPPEGISGQLIYVKDADLDDLQGKKIQGKIVLLDWKTGSKWIDVYRFGAKAVIFLNPEDATGFIPPLKHDAFDVTTLQTTTFMENLPLKFPRFYAPDSVKKVLLSHLGETVLIKSSTYWEKTKSWNILGIIPGTEWPDQSIMLVAHYDSYSDAPRYAPGAQEASSIAFLLELARYFQNNKPKHTIIFAAVGAHHQNLEGMVQLINDFFDPKLDDLGWFINYNILFVMQIALDTGSNELFWFPSTNGGYDAYTMSFWRGEAGGGSQQKWWTRDFFYSVYEDINNKKPGGKTYKVHYFDIRNMGDVHYDIANYYSWYTKYFDVEPLHFFGQGYSTMGYFPLTMVFTTAYYNKFLFRPFDEYSYVNLRNLQSQVELIACSIVSFVEADWTKDLINPQLINLVKTWFRDRETNIGIWKNTLAQGNFVGNWRYNATGIVGVWNESIGWYSPIPNAVVVYDGGGGSWHSSHRRMQLELPTWYRRITISDKNGRYLFRGGEGEGYVFRGYIASAWVIDPRTGDILYAPDLGIHKYGTPEDISWKLGIPDIGILAVFNCSQVVFDIFHPRSLGSPTLPTGQSRPAQIIIKNQRFEDIISFSVWSDGGLYIVAFPPEDSIKIMATSTIERYPFVMFLNSTPDNPEGYGFSLKPGEQHYIPIHQAISDMYIWTKTNLNKIATVLPSEEISSLIQDLTGIDKMLKEVNNALANGDYMKYLVLTKKSWDKALNAYLYFRTRSEGVVITVPFFSLIAIPFTILTEALFLNWSGKKKVISIVMIFSFLIISLYMLHPGFRIAASPIMNIIGFSMLILLLPIIGIMFTRISKFLRSVKIKYIGEHEIDISRMKGSFIPSFKLGVENMKKRKLRSGLTFTGILLMVLSVSLFTSISPLRVTAIGIHGLNPPYPGIEIRKDRWGEGGFNIGTRIVGFIQAEFGNRAYIAPRVWLYMFPIFRETIDPRGFFGYKIRSTETGNVVSIKTMWGLASQEKYITGIDNLIIEGRWFEEFEDTAPVCILTQEIAEKGNFKVGEKLTIAGTNFTVIGIISNDVEYFSDLDLEVGMSPIKYDMSAVNPWNIHVGTDYYIIVPYKIALLLGGRVASVAIRPYDPNQVSEIAQKLFDDINVHLIYYSSDNFVKTLSLRFSYTVFGLQSQIVPIALVILSLLNLLMSSIYERRREIHIFSSIGLSPTHIAVQFLAEAATYAVVGSIIGYILSLAVMKYMGGTLGLVLDYSSGTVALTIAICMAAVLASSLYPAITAARLVTPSLERRWTPPTKPIGDAWDIPLPFTVGSEEEVNKQIEFIKEFLRGHELTDAPVFSVKRYGDEQLTKDGTIIKRINVEMNLAPYDTGISQYASISWIKKPEEKVWEVILTLNRISGLTEDWTRTALNFIDEVRKQFLLWKSLPKKKA